MTDAVAHMTFKYMQPMLMLCMRCRHSFFDELIRYTLCKKLIFESG
jgi:hypothetical protein